MSELMTVPVILTFSDGEKLDVQISMPRKAYWPEQLEKEIMKAYNHNAPRKNQGHQGESLSQYKRGRIYNR
jgi:hypothetical protein